MGKASKQRPCPALGRTITPAECGEHRVSRYACPAECPFNPFAPAHYEQLLALEDEVDHKSLTALVADPVQRDVRERAMQSAMSAPPGHGQHATTVWELFFRRDERGLTFAQRWERAGFPGLKNDERVLFRAKMQMRVVLHETRRVVDHQQSFVRDLLEPQGGPLPVIDRSYAARAIRFGATIGWLYPLPHFWRLSGTAILVPEFGPFDAEVMLRETARHLGAPVGPGEAFDRWLAENFSRLDDALTATGHERRRRMFANLDAQWGIVDYELVAPVAECRAVLDAETALAPVPAEEGERAEGFTDARAWFDERPEAHALTAGQGRPLLGTVLLAPDRWRLQANGGARLAHLRALFETRLGSRVRFKAERRDDFGAQFALKEPAGDPALVVPTLLEQPDQFAVATSHVEAPLPGGTPEEQSAFFRQQHWRKFADEPIPALDGHTPRAAAADPVLRPRVLALLKRHVRGLDEANLRSGRQDDINWLLRDLGLHEIDEPPPPVRLRLQPAEDDVDEDEDDFDSRSPAAPSRAVRLSRPSVELPPRPFTHDEAVDRLQASLAQFTTASAAMDALDACGVTWLDDWYEITEGLIDEEHYDVLVPFLLMVWFSFLPQGVALPPLDRAAVRARMLKTIESLLIGPRDEAGDAVRRFMASARQPAFTEVVLDHFLNAVVRLPKKSRPSEAVQAAMSMTLRAAVEELDRALRG